jgi:hypothetical protein
MKGKALLEHMEKVHDDYEVLVDKIPLEDKLIASREEEAKGLEPWEISEITQQHLNKLPNEVSSELVPDIFDLVYDAITEALDRVRR